MHKLKRLAEHKLDALFLVLLVSLVSIQIKSHYGKIDLEKKLDDVVIVLVDDGDGNLSSGTGFFFNDSGCLMTAFHVIASKEKHQNKITIKLRGDRHAYPANAISGNGYLDVAIVCSEVSRPGLRIVSSEGLRQGDTVWAMGHPSGRTWNMTKGVISRMSYKMHEFNKNWMPRYDIFTTAFISWGNSGGPLLNENGDVVGMIVEWDNPGIPFPNSMNIAVTGTDLLRYTKSIWGR
jgi:S1-C subfamily serine protease